MKKLIETFVKYKFYANLIVAFLIIAGGLSFINMKKSFFPERATRDIHVSLSYPGASPKEMEESMTTRVEQAIRGIVGIKEINSTSSENFASIVITTTGQYDIDTTLQEVKNAVDAISSFPVDMERPVVSKRRSTTQAMYLALSGNVSLRTLKKYAQSIEDDLLNSNIVTQVSVTGFPATEISVEIPEKTLLRYKLTFSDVASAISNNNRDISAGMIRSEEQEILIRSRLRSVDPGKIGDIQLKAFADGRKLYIRDIAKVKLKFSEGASGSWLNGEQTVSISISKLAEEDLASISEYIRKYVKEFNAKDLGVKLHTTFDFMDILNSRLSLLYENGGIGLILVIVVLGLFLSTRLSLWVAWGIPSAFLAMYITALYFDVTINMISLFGMILVIGILVDDGIVIAENIYSHFERGKSPKKAAIEGTMEVMPAVITSVTTTIVAFSPLLMLTGTFEFFYEMGFVVIFSLFFSLFEAFLVLPAHIGTPHILRAEKRASRGAKIRANLEKWINILRFKMYGKLLRKIIDRKWIVLAIPVALFLITAGMFRGELIRYTFFPTIPFDNFTVDLAYKSGSGEARTRAQLISIDKKIWEVNEDLKKKYKTDQNYINFTYSNLGNSFSGVETGSHAGNIMVLLRDLEGSEVSSFQIVSLIRKKIGVIKGLEKFSISGRNRWGKPVSFSLLGKNIEELKLAKNFVFKSLEKNRSLSNLTTNDLPGKQEIRLRLKPKAYFLGLTHSYISNQVRQGFYGAQAQRLQSGKDEVRVWVRYPPQDRKSIGQLENMKIKTGAGEYPLSELVDYDVLRGPVKINHYNGSREIRFEADLADPYAPVPPILESINRDILSKMKEKYPGVHIAFQGQRKESDESSALMARYFMVAAAVILIILMIHFRSFSQPLIIVFMIPLSWLGVSWGHLIEGIPVSMLSAWGIMALSGVVINDAVVFLSTYNSALLKGDSIKDAVFHAGISRFRPIMLTSITTVAGLYPIVLEKSFQSQFLKPMAISLAYGVLFGTVFILVFMPVFILALNEIKFRFHQIFRGKKPENYRDLETVVINSKIKID